MSIDHTALRRTLKASRQALLSARVPQGHWVGRLSGSALSTATAACALELIGRANPGAATAADTASLVRNGLAWIAKHQNADGGWGDTADSPSNVSTTMLCWAAMRLSQGRASCHQTANERAERWLVERAGGLTPEHLARAIRDVYGADRTFSVPILAMCALSGLFGSGRDAWRFIPSLPFELAACPSSWFRRLGLPVVSYALPALIAIGQSRHHHRPTWNPVARLLRNLLRKRTLRILRSIQPEGGGFLEAAPLTSFVMMGLVSMGRHDHEVVRKGAAFLAATAREDGSWPIDTNLATWLTTLSIGALAGGDELSAHLTDSEQSNIRAWLRAQQYKTVHNYTQAAPGGWAWTDLSGGVPDADDTPGAMLALRHLALPDEGLRRDIADGARWLLDLQNNDGGIPTFCRGWGKLPFDRSSPDLTAHALRAWHAWREALPRALRRRIDGASDRAVRYLCRTQRDDGSWTPLWFGNQKTRGQTNPLYGTTRVLRVAADLPLNGISQRAWSRARRAALEWLLAAQHADGAWGGDASVSPSIEETALAVEVLADLVRERAGTGEDTATMADALERGAAWLVDKTSGGTRFEAAPIGLYFAKLWYSEELYPLIFTVSALERVSRLWAEGAMGRETSVAAATDAPRDTANGKNAARFEMRSAES